MLQVKQSRQMKALENDE